MNKKILLILLFALIVAIFAIQNAAPVLIRIFQWEFEISLVLIVLGGIVFGSMMMIFVSSFTQLKLSKRIKLLKKDNEELINEIEVLREKNQTLIEKIEQYESNIEINGSENEERDISPNNSIDEEITHDD